jgi:hypothetical protein
VVRLRASFFGAVESHSPRIAAIAAAAAFVVPRFLNFHGTLNIHAFEHRTFEAC